MQVGQVQRGGLAHQLGVRGGGVLVAGVVVGVAGVQPQADAPGTDGSGYLAQAFEGKTRAASGVAAVLVGAHIGARAEELHGQITAGAVQFHPIKTGFARVAGGLGVLLHHGPHLGGAQGAGHVVGLHPGAVSDYFARSLQR